MSLITRINRADTIGEFERAAEDRGDDADCLRGGTRHFWAVYTMGYRAEMLLKSAYFRCLGLPENEDLKSWLKPQDAQNWLKFMTGTGTFSKGALHDLLFLARLLIEERRYAAAHFGMGHAMPLELANRLLAEVKCIALNWEVRMRYWGSTPAAAEFREVKRAVSWIRQNHQRLWS
jgi:hypothetical protein